MATTGGLGGKERVGIALVGMQQSGEAGVQGNVRNSKMGHC